MSSASPPDAEAGRLFTANGRYTAEAILRRQQVAALIRARRELSGAAEIND